MRKRKESKKKKKESFNVRGMRDRDGVGSEERGREKKSKALDLNGRNVERETKLSLYSPIDVDADTCCMPA